MKINVEFRLSAIADQIDDRAAREAVQDSGDRRVTVPVDLDDIMAQLDTDDLLDELDERGQLPDGIDEIRAEIDDILDDIRALILRREAREAIIQLERLFAPLDGLE